MFVSATRVHVRSFWLLPRFFRFTNAAALQTATAAGFVRGSILAASPLSFWTVTIWRDDAAMRAYRGSGMHLSAMQHFASWCDEGSFAHWVQETPDLPAWETVLDHMQTFGRRSRVDHPSARHLSEPWIVPPPKWRTQRLLHPVSR